MSIQLLEKERTAVSSPWWPLVPHPFFAQTQALLRHFLFYFSILFKEPGIDHTYPLHTFPTLPLHAPPIASFDHRTQVSLETGYLNSSPCHLCPPCVSLCQRPGFASVETAFLHKSCPYLHLSSHPNNLLHSRLHFTTYLFIPQSQTQLQSFLNSNNAQPVNHVRSRGPPTSPDLHLW